MPFNEADTRAKLIDPALHSRGWTEDLIKREETAPTIDVVAGKGRRRGRGRTDYTPRIKVNTETQAVAVALIEAKAESRSPQHGLEQAKPYADCKRLNVSFVYSTNGHQFVEFDRFTGLTSPARPMGEFPTPADLRARYEQHMGFSLESPAASPLLIPYPGGEATRRYYQDAAIRAVLEKLARGGKDDNRALLSLVTGAGKTFIAVNLPRRISEAGQLSRALFVCDRDELRNQASVAFQNLFGANVAAVSSKNPQKNARILIATYQTLDVDSEEADANFLIENYPENYFSHIIIEAQADAQITADNILHFGPPVYEYDMPQGIEDGYPAACEIVKRDICINAKPQTEQETGIEYSDLIGVKLVDAGTGEPLSLDEIRKRYEAAGFEKDLVLPDRVKAMAQDLFNHLLATGGPEQKTIISCAGDRHADDVAIELNNLYAKWCAANGQQRLDHYAFKCTAASSGNDFLPDLRGAARHHFIATTVDLLSTGVDVPIVRNIVFFKYVGSAIAFYQMVGRGTRIDEGSGKLMFRVYDYTNATRLFGEDFTTRYKPNAEPTEPQDPIDKPPLVPLAEGLEFQVTDAGRMIVTTANGRAMPITIEEYKRQLAAKLITERRELIDSLVRAGLPPTALQLIGDMIDYDLYDVLAELGYGLNPRTRRERADAFRHKHEYWLHRLPKPTAATVTAIALQFANDGTEALESPQIFQTPEVVKAGGDDALTASGRPAGELMRETKERMFAA
ncbi:MAG TPA: DEAD/DEAH box helicase family protein [Blastocatellia bacterium]|nr:DEAD/DEAH box helicase family protein [Blastocatellia bacterium]